MLVGEPPICVPSGSVTEIKEPPGLPSRRGCMVMVIRSPGFSVFGFQPWRTKLDGELVSMLHSTALPEASVTVIWIQECGLVH